jgi:hypothetical protein
MYSVVMMTGAPKKSLWLLLPVFQKKYRRDLVIFLGIQKSYLMIAQISIRIKGSIAAMAHEARRGPS